MTRCAARVARRARTEIRQSRNRRFFLLRELNGIDYRILLFNARPFESLTTRYIEDANSTAYSRPNPATNGLACSRADEPRLRVDASAQHAT
ncbi:hypothetical protein C7S16_7165 [Burkholderia thailandensis]|uniref:Uncharacterized protein n=1 Tax=Burkholderia thailandensis TaxID=57975 RepID=A0AAW9CSW3_BURTH|nr:hypothetical protein [Burkholderia thailandensis]